MRIVILMFCAAVVLLSGCVSPENETRPWNAPAKWEQGPQTRPERR
jgi:hypothetical protein